MRLSSTERKAIVHALREVPYPVYLFGSRMDDTKRGGDIDMAILSSGLDAAERFNLSVRIAARFRSLCDEKIDVQVFDAESPAPSERAFLATIDRERIVPSELSATQSPGATVGAIAAGSKAAFASVRRPPSSRVC